MQPSTPNQFKVFSFGAKADQSRSRIPR